MNVRKLAAWAAVPLAIAGAIACGGGGGDKAKDAPSFQPTLAAEPSRSASAKASAKPAAPTIGDGTWVVSEDVPAGIYKVNAPVAEGCYWQISKSGSNGGDIINNDLPAGGRPKVTIKKGQDFTSRDCGTWTKVG